jgi:hypothetical protein
MRHLVASLCAFALVVLLAPQASHAEGKTGKDSGKLDAWVYLRAGRGDEVQMSGSTSDIRAAKHWREKDEALLYVRRGAKAWVIRDAATLGKITPLWAPVEALGKQMEALGKKMEVLGKEMEALGRKMERADSDGERDRLGHEMDELGKKMDALGRQMDALGKDMEKASDKAERELVVLVDEAIKSGKAVAVKAPL